MTTPNGQKWYAEILRDPRWQKKRLKIMERDGFTCRHCESKSKTLTVHHIYYESGKQPWEYPDGALITYCEDCHEKEETEKAHWDAAVALSMRYLGATNTDIERFLMILNDLQPEYGFGLFSLMCHLLDEQQDQSKRRGFLSNDQISQLAIAREKEKTV